VSPTKTAKPIKVPSGLQLVEGITQAYLVVVGSLGERGNFSGLSPARYEKGNGSPYTITERWVPELIPVLGSQPAGDVSHKPGGRLPLLFARPAVTPATVKRAATNFAAW